MSYSYEDGVEHVWRNLSKLHPYRQEMEKWEKPYRYEQYPRMMYRARRRPDGVVSVIDTDDRACTVQGAQISPDAAEKWSAANYQTVHNEQEFQKLLEAGWRPTPQDALAHYHARETMVADEAAHRNYLDRNMSDKAKAEAAAYEGESSEHSPEIPVATKKRGRPRKDAPQE